MMTGFSEAWILADQLEDLREPYRQNAIAWLETCMQRSLRTPRSDLLSFLGDLHPLVRKNFLHYTACVLEDASRYFGGGREVHAEVHTRVGRGVPPDRL